MPTVRAACGGRLEDRLDVSAEPYEQRSPLVCVDDKRDPWGSDTRQALPVRPGQPRRYDYEERRAGTCTLCLGFEPLRGWRHVDVTQRRTAHDLAVRMQARVDGHVPEAAVSRVVLAHLPPHPPAAL
jgi:hypothetical protein